MGDGATRERVIVVISMLGAARWRMEDAMQVRRRFIGALRVDPAVFVTLNPRIKVSLRW
jgi:hypothetical protein